MTMAYPPVGEVRLFEGILNANEAENVKELAKQLITALDAERAKQTRYAIIEQVRQDGDMVTLHVTGPFNTRHLAVQAMKGGRFPRVLLDGDPANYRWAYLRHPLAYYQAIEKADQPPEPSTVPHGHPEPYAFDDDKARQRYAEMSDAEKTKEFVKRGGKKPQKKRGRT